MTTKQAAERIIEPNWKNKTLFLGDNLHIMRRMNSSLMDLIYLDPPFNTGRKFRAPIGANKEITEIFSDIWREEDLDQLEHALLAQYKGEDLPLFSRARYKGFNPLYSAITASRATHGKWMFSYLIMMSMRLIEMRRLLKETGSIYLHCDPTASHYLKTVMDAIFGKENFRNEIIWHYNRFSRRGDAFPSMHDSILFYGNSKKIKFNKLLTQPRDTTRIRKGWHTVVDQGERKLLVYDQKKFDEAVKDGKIKLEKYSKVVPTNARRPALGNVWEIPILNPMSKERTGWDTQKPLPLLERIIQASSNEGDIVFDPFCGCATTLVAAEKLGRQWIGIDISPQAEVEIKKRMIKLAIDRGDNELAIWKGIHIRDLKKSVASLWRDEFGKLPHPRTHKNWLYGKQKGYCAGCGKHFEERHLEVDHYVPKSKGGTDHKSNLQLLCSACNRMKGNRPQAYLEAQLKRLGIILD